jgi:hypothetical protein
MPIRWQITLDKPPDVTVRGWRALLHAAWGAVGQWWETTCKPRHFAPGAATRYAYQPRSERWQKFNQAMAGRKLVKLGKYLSRNAAQDLIFCGDLRDEVLPRQQPRTFPTRVTITLPTPDYVPERPKNPSRPPLADELTRLSDDEYSEAEHIWVTEFERQLNAYREQHVLSGV